MRCSFRTAEGFLIGQGVTKRCRLSRLTNSALVYEPKCRVPANECSCAHGAQKNLGDLTTYWTYVIRFKGLKWIECTVDIYSNKIRFINCRDFLKFQILENLGPWLETNFVKKLVEFKTLIQWLFYPGNSLRQILQGQGGRVGWGSGWGGGKGSIDCKRIPEWSGEGDPWFSAASPSFSYRLSEAWSGPLSPG